MGERPNGFYTCDYNELEIKIDLKQILKISLDKLFENQKNIQGRVKSHKK